MQPLIDTLRPVLPSSLQNILAQTKPSDSSFVDLGSTRLMLANRITTMSSSEVVTSQKRLQLCQQIAAKCQNSASRELLLSCSLRDHLASSYSNKLQEANMCIVPVLFMGGSPEDYEAISVKHMSTAGNTNCLATWQYACKAGR